MRIRGTFGVLAFTVLIGSLGAAPLAAGSAPPGAAASSLNVILGGPSQVQPNNPACEWSANAYGGVAPYTYDWTDTRTTVHTSDPWYFRALPLSAVITLTVTDALGQTVTRTKSVSVFSSAPPCVT